MGATIGKWETPALAAFLRLCKKYGRLAAVAASTVSIVFSGAQDGIAAPTLRLPQPSARSGQDIITEHQMLAPVEARTAAENAIDKLLEGDRDEAQRQLNSALEVFPNYAVALTVRGMIEMNEGRVGMGATDFEEAIRADPAYGPPQLALASYYNDLGRYDDALALIARAIRLLPSAWQGHFEMARSLKGKKDYQAALHEATQAIRLAPPTVTPESRALLHYLRAHVLAQLRDFSGAKKEFEETLKADPDGDLAISSRRALDLFQSTGR